MTNSQLQYNIVNFNTVPIFNESLLPYLNNSMYSCLVKVDLLPLKLLVNSVLYCHTIHVMVPLQAVFPMNKQMKIWWWKIRTVGTVQQNVCPSSVMMFVVPTHACGLVLLCTSNTSDNILVELTQHRQVFRLLKVSTRQAYSTVVPPRQKVNKITLLKFQKTEAILFNTDGTLLISSAFRMLSGTIQSLVGWSRGQNGGPRFQPLWKLMTGSPHLLHCISAVTFLASLRASSASVALNECRTWNSQAMKRANVWCPFP